MWVRFLLPLPVLNGEYGEVVNTADCGSVMRGFESHYSPHQKSIGLIQIVSDLFSLQIGNFILSASSVQSLIEVLNGIFMRLFFFLYIATERKTHQRNDRCFNGTIDFTWASATKTHFLHSNQKIFFRKP